MWRQQRTSSTGGAADPPLGAPQVPGPTGSPARSAPTQTGAFLRQQASDCPRQMSRSLDRPRCRLARGRAFRVQHRSEPASNRTKAVWRQPGFFWAAGGLSVPGRHTRDQDTPAVSALHVLTWTRNDLNQPEQLIKRGLIQTSSGNNMNAFVDTTSPSRDPQ